MQKPKKVGEALYESMYNELAKKLLEKDITILNLQQEKAQLQQRLDDLAELEQYLKQQRAYQQLVITPVMTTSRLR